MLKVKYHSLIFHSVSEAALSEAVCTCSEDAGKDGVSEAAASEAAAAEDKELFDEAPELLDKEALSEIKEETDGVLLWPEFSSPLSCV